MSTVPSALLRPARALAALLAVPALAVAQARDVEDVLSAARGALGWDRLVGSPAAVRVESAARYLGTEGRHVLLFDGLGRLVERFEGPLAQSGGLDGEIAWVRDWTDTPRTLVLGDRAEAELAALFQTGRWTACGPLLAFELAADGDGETVLSFVHADGVQHGTVHLDPDTHLPRSVRYGADATPTTWTFADWREHDGFRYPGHVDRAPGESSKQTYELRSIERVAEVGAADFAARLTPPADVRFDPDAPAELEVLRVPTGHLLVKPYVDGEDFGWFIFDSGAGTMCISKAIGSDFLEGPLGEIGARGMGGSVAAHFWRAEELRLGPLVMEKPVFIGLDLSFLDRHFGVPVAGIIGYELLARCVAELDVVEARIALHHPERYALPADGRWEALELHGRQPTVRAEFEGREGRFRVDTGAGADTVTFHYQVVHDLDLLQGRETRPGASGGVGGHVTTRVGELASFRLAGRDFGAISASFVTEDKGALSDDYVQGNIGSKLLEPFRLVLDYPGGRMGFVPRAAKSD